jgi:hypothetical protein
MYAGPIGWSTSNPDEAGVDVMLHTVSPSRRSRSLHSPRRASSQNAVECEFLQRHLVSAVTLSPAGAI